jgi:hypothetical protein
MISQDHDTAEKMMSLFDFTNRHSSYYRHAAEILGLVQNDDNNKYKLADRGEEYLKAVDMLTINEEHRLKSWSYGIISANLVAK